MQNESVPFDIKNYWEVRYSQRFDLAASGNQTLGLDYNHWLYKAKARSFLRAIKKHNIPVAGAKVLDVGCGTGFFVEQCTKLGAAYIAGVDIAEKSIQTLRQKYKDTTKYDFKHADVGKGNTTLEARYQLILVFDLLYLLMSDEEFVNAVRYIRQHARDNAYILISDVFGDTDILHNSYIKFRSYSAYEQTLKNNGIEIVDVFPQYHLLIEKFSVERRWMSLRLNHLLAPILYFLDGILLKYPGFFSHERRIKLMAAKVIE